MHTNSLQKSLLQDNILTPAVTWHKGYTVERMRDGSRSCCSRTSRISCRIPSALNSSVNESGCPFLDIATMDVMYTVKFTFGLILVFVYWMANDVEGSCNSFLIFWSNNKAAQSSSSFCMSGFISVALRGRRWVHFQVHILIWIQIFSENVPLTKWLLFLCGLLKELGVGVTVPESIP